MTSSQPVYEHLSSPAEMSIDVRAAHARLAGTDPAGVPAIVRAASRPAPSLRFEDFPRDAVKPEISQVAAARRIAAALHLSLD